jgi:hypothetical protein
MAVIYLPTVPAPDDLTILMQRLRTLQLRLNSVDPGVVQAAAERVLEWRSAAGEVKAAESRRRRLHAYVTESVDGVVTDFEYRMHNEFLPRLTQSFRNLLPEIQNRGAEITRTREEELEDHYNSRVIAVERSSAAAAAQMDELRNASAEVYRKLATVAERFDQILAEDDEALAGWRDAMEKVKTEQEAMDVSPMEAFREDAFGFDDDDDEPTTVRLRCPVCHERTGKRQPRTGFFEDLGGIINIAPYRCSRCMVRFYRYRPSRRRKN